MASMPYHMQNMMHSGMSGGYRAKRARHFDGDSELVEFKPLGSGREVGRSCHLLRLKGKTILLDCGLHPAYTGSAALPYLDEIEVSDIDLVLITHFHLDHIGGLPYLLRNPDFRGEVYMTHPTRAIYRLIMEDFLKASASSAVPGGPVAASTSDSLFTMKDVVDTLARIKVVNFHSTVVVKGVRLRPYHAGHVLGAAMFMIEVGDTKLLYTGDYSRVEDRHLVAAEVPDVKPDILVVEATHGGLVLPPRQQEEKTFGRFIHNVVKRGGKCLIPQFALGRIQELLLIIESYWEAHPALHDVPIYYASDLARRAMDVYKTFINVMNKSIRAQAAVRNPFHFKHITFATPSMQIDQSGPCVVFASQGMLTGGLALQLFDSWCADKRNGVMIAGYNVEGTLAFELLHSPPQFHRTRQGTSVEVKIEVGGVSMSNHADSKETIEFVRAVQPTYCILVHGNPIGMLSLERRLNEEFRSRGLQAVSPDNCQTVEIRLPKRTLVKAVGSLAAAAGSDARPLAATSGATLSGIVVRRPAHEASAFLFLDPSDVGQFALPLVAAGFTSKLRVPWWGTWAGARILVGGTFDVEGDTEDDELAALAHRAGSATAAAALPRPLRSRQLALLGGSLTLTQHPMPLTKQTPFHEWREGGSQGPLPPILYEPQLVISWASSALTDMAVDALVAMFMAVEANPGAVKMLSKGASGCCAAESVPVPAEDESKETTELAAQQSMLPPAPTADSTAADADHVAAMTPASAPAGTAPTAAAVGVKTEDGSVKIEPSSKPTLTPSPASSTPVHLTGTCLVDGIPSYASQKQASAATRAAFDAALKAELAAPVATADASAGASGAGAAGLAVVPASAAADSVSEDPTALHATDAWDPRWSLAALADLGSLVQGSFGAGAFALDRAGRAASFARAAAAGTTGEFAKLAVARAAEHVPLPAAPVPVLPVGIGMEADPDAAAVIAAGGGNGLEAVAWAISPAVGGALLSALANIATAAAGSAPVAHPDTPALPAPAALRSFLARECRRDHRLSPLGFHTPVLVWAIDGVLGLFRTSDLRAVALTHTAYASLVTRVAAAAGDANAVPLPAAVYAQVAASVVPAVERQVGRACGVLFPLRLTDVVATAAVIAAPTGSAAAAAGEAAGDDADAVQVRLIDATGEDVQTQEVQDSEGPAAATAAGSGTGASAAKLDISGFIASNARTGDEEEEERDVISPSL